MLPKSEAIAMNESRTIAVLTDRVPEALEALQKLARKARRYGCPDITVSVGKAHVATHTVRDWDGEERQVKLSHTDLIISGEAPKFGKHEFLARIELGEAGNVVDTAPGVEDLDERFRHSTGYCDHCHSDRRRKEVFAVRNTETGEQVQIGRSCLRDYLGIDDPAKIARRFAFWREARDLEDDYGFGRLKWSQSLEGALALAAVCVRLFGWCSKSQAKYSDATPTAAYVWTALEDDKKLSGRDRALKERILTERSDADYALAKATIAWVREAMGGRSDYEHNLKMIFGADALYDERRLGLAVSAIAAYNRAHEQATLRTVEREAVKQSQHVGKVGERLRGMLVTLKDQRAIDSTQWGNVVLVKFVDAEGNLLSWFTSRGTGLETGTQVLLDGTVKRHSEYNGTMETQMTRCALSKAA